MALLMMMMIMVIIVTMMVMKTALMMIAKIMVIGDVGDNDCGVDNNGEQDGNSEDHCGSNDVIKNPLKTSGS